MFGKSMGNPLENPLEMLENPWEIRVFQIIHDAKGNPMGKSIPRGRHEFP
jgi:hypothetical protein